MPFQDNPNTIPLFDTLNGGPPRAWECKACGRVCKRLGDMTQHQEKAHGFKAQQEMNLEERKPDESGTTGTGEQIPASEPPNARGGI